MVGTQRDFRDIIVSELSVLMKKEQQDRNVFKARAYGKVIAQIKGLDKPIGSMEDLDDVDGIGEKIRLKIEEILVTGKLEAAELIKDDSGNEMMEVLTNIYGIGPVKAKNILADYPVRSITEFRKVVEDHPDILHEKQKVGLKFYEDFIARIPKREMEKHERYLLTTVKEISDVFRGNIVGSYRRGAKDSGDIDMLVGYPETMPDDEASKLFNELIERMKSAGYVSDVLAQGPKKFMGVCKLPRHTHSRRLDLLLTSAKEYPYALLYFTGSQKYNIQVRKHALTKGYTLNEHAMKPIKDGVPEVPDNLTSEEQVLEFLGLEYTPPNKRV